MARDMERIFLAFSLSVVGSLITKQFGGLWWVGGLVGFALGYIGYDVRGFVRAIPAAFRRASTRPEPSITAKEWVANVCHCTFYTIGAAMSVMLTIATLMFTFLTGIDHIILGPRYWTAIAGISIFFALYLVGVTWSSASNPKHHDSHIELMSDFILWVHPILFVLRTLPIGIFYALRGVAWVTEKGSELIWLFIYHLIRLVHSNERILFGIDVAIGSLVGGHYLDNAIVGGLAGMVWWIFDHHLISVKWLKIEPVAR